MFGWIRRKMNDLAIATADKILTLVIVLVVGAYAVAYVLPDAMAALGNTTTTYWPTGTGSFITPIGIFIMIALLVLFARAATD